MEGTTGKLNPQWLSWSDEDKEGSLHQTRDFLQEDKEQVQQKIDENTKELNGWEKSLGRFPERKNIILLIKKNEGKLIPLQEKMDKLEKDLKYLGQLERQFKLGPYKEQERVDSHSVFSSKTASGESSAATSTEILSKGHIKEDLV